MPRKYQRKNLDMSKRGQWTEDNLKEAIRRINAMEIGINEASRYYGIPARTIRRRRTTGILTKLPLGPQGILGIQNEKRLVKHIQTLEKSGFAPNRNTVKSLAYQFAQKLGIKHSFNHETQLAGHAWLLSFLERNKELSIRQAEGLSLARCQGMSREEVKGFFDVLLKVFTDNNLLDNPGNIYNMDESGVQLNNKPGKVLATKGAKDVYSITSSERGENVTVIACCNAEGTFLPPVLVMKGVRQKPEFGDGLPPGSKIYMNKQSSFINSDLFLKWLKEHFLPRKGEGKSLLILDGHTSHCNAFEMLEFAERNDILIVCLPSHTTQSLQPLDRSFFKSFKGYFKEVTAQWMLHNKNRKITRLQAGSLIGKAWSKAASVEIAINGFRATGIYPYNPNVIPDHFFAISDGSIMQNRTAFIESLANQSETQVQHRAASVELMAGPSGTQEDNMAASIEPIAGPSGTQVHFDHVTPIGRPTQTQVVHVTPTKYLHQISPIPKIPLATKNKRKQSAALLTSPEHINERKTKLQKAEEVEKLKKQAQAGKDTPVLATEEEVDSNCCVECLENYYTTKAKSDWVQCVSCKKWMHETCTMYLVKCNFCGREEKRNKVRKN